MKILVIGDSCTDIFIYGEIDRICPEAPVPVFKPIRETKNDGMAKNVKSNLEALGCEVDIITNPNDIKKTRYVDNDGKSKIIGIYKINDSLLDRHEEKKRNLQKIEGPNFSFAIDKSNQKWQF